MQSAPKHSQTLAGVWLNKFSILLHYTYYMQTKKQLSEAKDIATAANGIQKNERMDHKGKTKQWHHGKCCITRRVRFHFPASIHINSYSVVSCDIERVSC